MNQKCGVKRLIPRVALVGGVVLTLLLGLPQQAFAPIDAIVTRVTQTETALVVEALIGSGIDEQAREGLRDFRIEIILSYPELAMPFSMVVPVVKTNRLGNVGVRTVAVSVDIPTTTFPKSYITVTCRIINYTFEGKVVAVTNRTATTISCFKSDVGLLKPQ